MNHLPCFRRRGVFRLNRISSGIAKIALLTPCLFCEPTLGDTVTWTNKQGGDWFNAINWSPNQVPGANATAIVEISATITNSAPITVSNFNFAGGTLRANPVLTVTGEMKWNGGTIQNGSILNIAPGAMLMLTNNATRDLVNVTLNNSGTVFWSDGSIRAGNGTVINNAGLWRAESNDSLNGSVLGGSSWFTNSGTFRKTVGTGTTSLTGISVHNTGLFEIQTGTINLAGGLTGNGNFNGIGTVQLSGAINATINGVANWSGGSIGNDSTLAINGTVNWSGGSINSGSILTVTPGAILIFSGGTHDLPGTTLENFGTVIWTQGSLRGGNGTAINNSGLWRVEGDDAFNGAVLGGTSFFTNTGTFRKIIDTGTTTFSGVAVHNTGLIDVQSGIVNLGGGLSGSGNYDGTGAIQLSGLVNATMSGTANWSGGNISSDSSLAIAGTVNWLGGTVNSGSTLSVVPGGTLILSGGTHDFPGTTLNNAGSVLWTGGSLRGGNGTAVNNVGVWTIQGNNSFSGTVFGGSSAFTNSGVLRKTAVTGTTTFSAVPLHNTGTIDVQSGTLNLNSALTGAGEFSGAGFLQLNGFVNIVASGSLNWSGGSVTAGSSLTLATNSTLNLLGGTHDFPGSTLNNFGSVIWSDGSVRGGQGTVVNNFGVWLARSDDSFSGAVFGGASSFTNSGIFRKAMAPGKSDYSATPMHNVGTIDVQSGTVNFQDGLTGNGFFSGAGFLQFGGMIDAVVNGTMNWYATSGTTSGSVLTVATNSTLNIVGGTHDFPGSTLNNFGLVNWTNGAIRGGLGTLIRNAGQWTLRSDDSFSGTTFGGTSTFTNSGTLRKIESTGVSTLTAAFYNSGTIDLQSGRISFNGTALQSAGEFGLNGGSVTFSEPFEMRGGLLWGTNSISGTVTNNGIIKPGGDAAGLLTISGSYIQTAQGRLDLQLGGTNAGVNYDRLAVSGAARFDGAMDLTLLDPFFPAESEAFRVITFGSFTGDFANVEGLVISTNLALQANYSANALDLIAVATNALAVGPKIIAQPQSVTIINGQTATFNVTASGTRPLHYQWQFNGNNLPGETGVKLTLANAQTNATGEYRVVITNTANAVTSSIATLLVRPVSDLVITDVANPTNGFGAQPVTFTWRTLNQGSQSAIAPWIETVGLSSNPTGIPATTISTISANTSLASGQSIVRTQSVILPGGWDGTYYVVWRADANNQVVEEDNEANNLTVSSAPITIHSPDLRLASVAVSASAQFGESVSVSWIVTNNSASPVFSPWSDRVFLSAVSNSLSGATFLGTANLTDVPLAAGATATNSANIAMPLAQNLTAGNYFIVIAADYANAIAETNENNNLLSAPISLSFPPLPDLAVGNIVAPADTQPGATVPVSWSITNRGNFFANGIWSETVLLATNNSGGGAIELATFAFTNLLDADGVLTRTQSVTIPLTSPLGNTWFAVQTDSRNDLIEQSKTNNFATATNATLIPAVLTLQLSANQVTETGASFLGIVTRNGSRASPLTVDLTNDSPGELTLPAQLTIAAGQSSAVFSVSPVHDGIVDGPKVAAISVGALNFSSASAQVTVLDSDRANLSIMFETNSVREGFTVAATVRRDSLTNLDLVVTLGSSNPGRLMVPSQVIIPAGEFSATFAVLAVDNSVVQLPADYTVSALADNYNSASAAITVLDDDLPEILLTLASTNISENAGPQATIGMVQRSPVTDASIYVELESSDPGSLLVPSVVMIPAGESTASFNVAAVDNNSIEGLREVQIRSWVKTSSLGARAGEGPSVLVSVNDDDGPALELSLAKTVLAEGLNPATTATVSRNSQTNGALMVNLSSSDVNEAIVSSSVTIPAGAISTTFEIATLDDHISDGSKNVSITASASGFASATTAFTVTDVNLPDLVIAAVSAPSNAVTETFVNLGYTIRNQGPGNMASNTIVQRIYLSPTPVPGGELMGEYSFNGPLPAGSQFGQSFAVRAPQIPGDYWIVIETDVSNAVEEILENNNTRISSMPLYLIAAYDAVVSTTLESAAANTPVPLTGHAFKPGNAPAPFVPVNIHLNVRGTHRVISAITDGSGNFSTTWQPLPGEAGFYEIGAAHPGYTNAPAQDSFSLYGMHAMPGSVALTLSGSGSVTGAVQIVNSGDLALSGVAAQVLNVPANLNFNVSLANDAISGLAADELSYSIQSTDGLTGSGTVIVRLTSAEGATLDVPFSINVKPLISQLAVEPAQLVRGIKRGEQSFASLTITNIGGAVSGPITVSLPAISWIHFASINPLPSLNPGESATVVLQLTPPADAPLGVVSGNILLSTADGNSSVPFEFRVLSEAKGDFRMTAVDEFTYYAAGAPPLTNATATLRDAVSGNVITNGVTDANGEWRVSQLPEGYYELEVTAEKHSAYRGTHLLLGGVTNEVSAFLSRETVRYTWTVVPTEVEDRYRIVVETEFEANVPAPVVTITPSVIDLADMPGDEWQVNLTVENHGLIAAQDFELQFDEHPDVTFEPLVSSLGTLPPKSSFVVPLTIRRGTGIGLRAKGIAAAAAASSGPCFAVGRGVDHFQCGPYFNVQVATINFPNAGQCIWDAIPPISVGWVPGSGVVLPPPLPPHCVGDCGGPGIPGSWTTGSGGGDGRLLSLLLAAVYKSIPALAVPNPCDPECLKKLIPALIECLPLPEVPSLEPNECVKAFSACQNNAGAPTDEAAVGCLSGGLNCAIEKGLEKFPVLDCVKKILEACAPEEEERPAASSLVRARRAAKTFSGPYAGLLGTLQTRVDRILAVQEYYTYFYGDLAWSDSEDPEAVKVFLAEFGARTDAASDSGTTVSAAELSSLLALPFPAGITSVDVNHLVERWNRTMTYWQAGIFNLAQVPAGNSTDFIALDQMNAISSLAANAITESEAEGFTSLAAGVNAATAEIADVLNSGTGGTCAKVKLRLNQDAVLSRDAFRATLEIENTEGQALENVFVTLGVVDAAGNDASALFGIRAPELTGISGTNGSGTLANGSAGQMAWTLIPTVDAADAGPTRYFVSGGLNYVVDGNAVSIPLSPAAITVYPSPRLTLQYFHQRDVFSDDPYTDEIEPAVPFTLGVMVKNNGLGTARDFRIESAQPQIVENEKGLLIDFKIIATEVAGKNLQPTLMADFGDLGPETNAIARWLMTSTLQGLFIDYKASFEHVDDLGNSKLSLIDDVSIHELVHAVNATGAFEDHRPDFLVNDVPDPRDYPDTLYLSDGSTNSVEVVTNGVVTGNLTSENLEIQLDAPVPGGWVYLRVPDPADGQYQLVSVIRSDSVVVPIESNVWITDRTFPGLGKKPVRENILHLLDYNSTGSYTLIYGLKPELDVIPPISQVNALPLESSTVIALHWSGEDDSSGVAAFDIYVSENGGPFQRWLANAVNTSAVYEGVFGNTYAFYSVATDQSGNRESAPSSPDATTTVARTNHPPVIAAISNRTLLEGETLSLTANTSDPDADAITFALGAGAPAGVQIHSQNGLLTWSTGEGHGPGTNLISIIVRDNGLPQLSATQTFQVIVLEDNQRPTLAAIPDLTISEGSLLMLTNVASDLDLPAQKLSFSLENGAPTGASINAKSGVLTWEPSGLQGGSTYSITVKVTDDGQPPMSASRTFSVQVVDTHPDLVFDIGTTQLLAGATAAIPLVLSTGADVTNVTMLLNVSGDRLTDLALTDLATELAFAEIQSAGSNRYQLRFSSLPNSLLQGDRSIAQLAFGTTANSDSEIVHLSGEGLVGKSASSVTPLNGVAHAGRIFVLGEKPILDVATATNHFAALTIYGLPGKRYSLEKFSTLGGTNEPTVASVFILDNLKTELPWIAMDQPMEFFRARRLPESELVLRSQAGAVTIDWPLECADCVLEQSSSLGSTAVWTPAEVTPTLVNGRWQVNLPATPEPRFYRLILPR
ncbi:MAG TPA: CARDB domain-containing protein [Verrucomicrobiae bacterium]|nr:CARDB domain-containing protein [Verrucomicrobiae bacterium]